MYMPLYHTILPYTVKTKTKGLVDVEVSSMNLLICMHE